MGREKCILHPSTGKSNVPKTRFDHRRNFSFTGFARTSRISCRLLSLNELNMTKSSPKRKTIGKKAMILDEAVSAVLPTSSSCQWEFDPYAGVARYHPRLVERKDELRSYFDEKMQDAASCSSGSANYFHQSSDCFGALVAALSDCRDRSQKNSGLFLALDIYDIVCFHQLQEFAKLTAESVEPFDAFKRARFHKGHLLWEIVKMLDSLGYEWLKRRYTQLTLIEDILSRFFFSSKGSVSLSGSDLKFDKLSKPSMKSQLTELYQRTGCAELLAQELQIKEKDIGKLVEDLVAKIGDKFVLTRDAWLAQNGDKWPLELAMFPEWILGRVEVLSAYPKRPVTGERDFYLASRTYFHWVWYLFALAKKKTNNNVKGAVFEEICRYQACCVPGIRVARDLLGTAGQTDLLLIVEGMLRDFRDSCGPHIIAECKSGSDGGSKGNVAELIGKSVLFNSHILFSIDDTTTAGKTLEYVSLLKQDRSFVHFGPNEIAPDNFRNEPKKGESDPLKKSDWNAEEVWDRMRCSFDQLLTKERLKLSSLHSEFPITDFLFDWRNKYEQSKLELFREAKKAQTK